MTIKASNFPTTRPSLDLNFAQTKRLDPRVTFSRASSATFVDVDGLIKSAATNVARFDHNPTTGESLGLLAEEARTNLITYSDYFTGWSFTSSTGTTRFTIIPDQYVSPDNTINGDFIRETTANGPGYYQRTLSISAGSYFSISCYVYGVGNYASNTARRVILGLFPTSSNSSVDGYTVAFNLFSSTVTSSRLGRPVWDGGTGTSAVFTETGSKITNVGNGWRKIEVYGKCSVANPIIIFTTLNRELNSGDNDGGGALTMTGDGSSGIGVWGFQAEAGSFPTSYIPTPATFTGRSSTATFYDSAGVIQTAASGVARSNAFLPDSNGVFRPAGLLLEAAGTNLVTYSEQFDNAGWSKNLVGVSANAGVAPDGTSTADQVSNTPNSTSWCRPTVNISNSITYTFSLYVKPLTTNKTLIFETTNGQVIFNLATLTTSGTGVRQIVPVANGWYRIVWTFANISGLGGFPQFPTLFIGGYPSTSDSVSFLFWGTQVEEGSLPTSYIPTVASTVTRAADTSTSATVTRSADVAQITGTNFSSWYRQDAGTFLANYKRSASGRTGIITGSGGGEFGWSMIADELSSRGFTIRTSVIEYFDNPTILPGANVKQAGAYDATGSSLCVNARAPVSRTHSLVSPAGISIAGSTNSYYTPLSAPLARLTYWPTRLSDATLQSITR